MVCGIVTWIVNLSNLYTIPLGQTYLKTLAKGIAERFGPELTVLLPSNRGVLSLQKSFLKLGQSLVLPKILTLTDYCERETSKSISSLERIHVVLRLLKKELPSSSTSHLMKLATNIVSLWDEFTLSGVDLTNQDFDHALFSKITKAYCALGYLDEKMVLYKSISTKEIDGPMLLAGTTGTIPAVQDFAKRLLSKSDGYVVLPGYTKGSYAITHPLYTQAKFVEFLDQEVVLWNSDRPTKNVKDIFGDTLTEPFDHMSVLNAKTPFYEACAIATVVRHHLEQGAEDIAIVCPDPKLSTLIQDALSRFGFKANSSLGRTIQETQAYKLLNLALNFLENQCLKTLVPLIKHPLSKFNAHDIKIELDDQIAYNKLLQNCFKVPEVSHNLFDMVHGFLNEVSDGKAFSQTDGKQIEDFLNSLKGLNYTKSLPHFCDYIRALFSLCPSPQSFDNLHQKVTLLGTVEARHIESSVVILAGLNEGYWPPTLGHDLWLSEQDRLTLGLPPKERRLGLCAHDFASCLSADTVYLTRSLKIDGTPTEPSRFLRRLSGIREDTWFLDIAEALMSADILETIGPTLTLAAIHTPKSLSISALELLNKNPYLFYAQYILHLWPRAPWFLGLSALDIGNLIHKALETNIEPDLDKLTIPNARKLFLKAQLKNILAFVELHTDPSDVIYREREFFFDYEGIKIKGIADRLDVKSTGDVHLIDYKTGTPASKSMIDKGLSLQMSLLEHMVRLELGDQVAHPEYWALKGYGKGSEIISVKTNPIALEVMRMLIHHYFLGNNPFLETNHFYVRAGCHPFVRGNG